MSTSTSRMPVYLPSSFTYVQFWLRFCQAKVARCHPKCELQELESCSIYFHDSLRLFRVFLARIAAASSHFFSPSFLARLLYDWSRLAAWFPLSARFGFKTVWVRTQLQNHDETEKRKQYEFVPSCPAPQIQVPSYLHIGTPPLPSILSVPYITPLPVSLYHTDFGAFDTLLSTLAVLCFKILDMLDWRMDKFHTTTDQQSWTTVPLALLHLWIPPSFEIYYFIG